MSKDLYFRYPILDLSYGQRFMRRTGRSIFKIVVLVSALVMVFSDVPNLVFVGGVLMVVVFYTLGAGALRSRVAGSFKGGNLEGFMTRNSKKVILAAYNRATFLGGSFVLHLARELVESPLIIRVLRGMEVSRDEFVSKLESYIDDERGVKETNIWRQAKVEELVKAAFIVQSGDKGPIEPFHLFLALPQTGHERVRRLFNLFGLNPVRLEKAARYHNIISS